MTRNLDLLLTAIAPAIWGSTYIVTTELLPHGYPLSVAMLRALPAGLLLVLFVRQLPQGIWWLRVLVLGGLNFSLFGWLLFIAAYRLPGGVAATVISIQPLVIILLARLLLGLPLRPLAVVAALAGMGGVALLVLTPHAVLDPVGVVAGLASALAMASGTVLTRKWQPPVSLLTFTAWQIAAGGLLLLPFALWLESPLPRLSMANVAGFAYLGLIGTVFAYLLWFRGLARLDPRVIAPLGFLSPMTAVILGWSILGQQMSLAQVAGVAVVIGSVWLSQYAQSRRLASGPEAPLATTRS